MKRRSRSLGDTSSHHEAKAYTYAAELTKQATRTADYLDAGNCRFIYNRVVEEASLEGALRAHYSSVREDRRGPGTDLHATALKAENVAHYAREAYKNKCVRKAPGLAGSRKR